MRYLLAPIKFFLVICIVVSYLIVGFLTGLIVRDEWKLRKIRNKYISIWSKFALKVLRLHVKIEGLPIDKTKPYLIVSNHLTYLDVIVLSSHLPTCFVTSREVEKTPVLGEICRMGGCLFVDRRNRANLGNEIEEITEALKRGLNVTIFPEATSTNGEQVLRFRRPLYNGAILSETDTLALCINYESIDGVQVTRKNRDKVFWYGDMSFLPHILNLTLVRDVQVSLKNLGTVRAQQEVSCTVLAEVSHQMVSTHFVNL